ncbi:RNA-directed DNA polymerase, eukaryota [Artemisia annua]|uniref:RNA-directed DNA polymerase, eukaryota n=1 Tax=Artemisia annua TaxID=35608 RepID=A0A2U1PXJ3_ARTAN|nr:RNA-directed DNA polymerase, eukaryota [Artemisia annua]
MSLFPAPVTVLRDLEGLRACVLWGTDVGEKKLHWVSWSRVMTSRAEGDSSIIRMLCGSMLFVLYTVIVVGCVCPRLELILGRGRDFYQIRVGNGQLTDFWRDMWLGSTPLFTQFSRIFALDDSQFISVAERMRIGLVASSLRREPRGGVETEQWEAISALIQAFNFSPQQDRIALTRIPTRDNLESRGIVLDSNLCPVCATSLETVEHVFADCVELRSIWSNISRWWNVPTPSLVLVDSIINWADQSKLSVLQRKCFDAVMCTTFWVL